MLRNKYLNKYESQNNIELSTEEKNFLVHNENYHLYLDRPLETKKIYTIKSQKIYQFIDDVMCNKNLNYLLYSSNAKKIASFYLKQKKFLLRQHAPSQTADDNIFTKKAVTFADKLKREALFENIKSNIEKFKVNRKRYMTQMMEKNDELLNSQPNIDKKLEVISSKSVNEIRLKGYRKAFNKCLNLSLRNDFKFSNDSTDDVYNRLYNNYSKKINYKDIKKQKDEKNNFNYKLFLKNKKVLKRNSLSELTTINHQPTRKILKFKLNSNLTQSEHNLKQFNMNITKKMIKKCWSKISGGPKKKNIKNEDSKSNEFKKKFNYRILSFKKKVEPNDISLYNTMVVDDPFLKKVRVINKNYRDIRNNSALHIAVNNDSLFMVSYLLNKKNKNINAKNNKGQTALHIACKKGNEEIINLLVQNGASVNALDNNGNKPFDLLSSDRFVN